MNKALIVIMAFYYFYVAMLGLFMFIKRYRAALDQRVHPRHYKAYTGDAPQDLFVMKNHYSNQFEIPLIFFVVCLLALQQNAVTTLTLGLAGAFVLSRIIHSFIHLGRNHVLMRAAAYFTGMILVGGLFLQVLVAH